MEEMITMSKKEVDRCAVLEQVRKRQLKQCEAAEILDITDRHIRNLLTAYKNEGARGLISKKRGRPSNNQKPKELKKKVLSLIQSKYEGFGPTFASEKFEELDGIQINSETLRLWMIESNIWIPRESRRNAHPPRKRRACFGELIQVDGSHHRWFGPDGPMVTLLVFIDDATSKVTALHFCEQETLDDYFKTLEVHLKQYGIPRGIYSDRLKVFNGEKQLSQFQQALCSLEIESILAQSAEAKGRVERVNRTLQDRLVKELMLRGITTIEEANKFLSEYLSKHNAKFSKEPASIFDAHRPLEKDHDVERLLCKREERTLSKDYIFQFHNRCYKIKEVPEIRRPKGRKVEVRLTRNGKMRVFLESLELEFCDLEGITAPTQAPIMDRTEVLHWKPKKSRCVPRTHPWKDRFRREKVKKEMSVNMV